MLMQNDRGRSVTSKEILDALKEVAGESATKLVDFTDDPTLRKIVDSWASDYRTERAESLGLTSDESVLSIVQQYKQVFDQGRG